MTVEKGDVIAAYRLLLGRDPESEEAINNLLAVENWQVLRGFFLTSAEFQTGDIIKGAAPRWLGRHLDATEAPVEVECDPIARQAMFDRIAGCWRTMGENEPHWSVLVNNLYRRETLKANEAAFYAHGEHDVARLLGFASRAGYDIDAFRRACDFGCGVGRLTIPLSRHAAETVGVDISEGHLKEARAFAGDRNIAFRRIDTVADIGGIGRFDLIVSRIVLQHNPPPVMAEIYRLLLRALAPGGISIIQMPTFIRDYRFNASEYLAGPVVMMEMNMLPQRDIFRIIAEEGCRAVEVREDDHLGAVDGLSHVFAVVRPA